MIEFKSQSRAPKKKPKFALRGIETSSTSPTIIAQSVIGFAHIGLGALNLVTGIAALSFASVGSFPLPAIAGVVLIGGAALMILAGLWIRDGLRKGAYLAAALDAVRATLLLLVSVELSVDVILAIGMLAATVWLLPTLGAVETAES